MLTMCMGMSMSVGIIRPMISRKSYLKSFTRTFASSSKYHYNVDKSALVASILNMCAALTSVPVESEDTYPSLQV